MNHQPLNNQNFSNNAPKRVGRARPVSVIPWPWLILALVLHGVVGVLLSVFSPPGWVWPLAFAGTVVQSLMLSGPRALSALKGWRIILSRWGTCLGVAMSVVALAVGVGYGGTDNIDAIRFGQTGLTLFLVNLGVLVLTAMCSLLIAYTGDRLLLGTGRARSSLGILSVCFLGLFFGEAMGLAIAS